MSRQVDVFRCYFIEVYYLSSTQRSEGRFALPSPRRSRQSRSASSPRTYSASSFAGDYCSRRCLLHFISGVRLGLVWGRCLCRRAKINSSIPNQGGRHLIGCPGRSRGASSIRLRPRLQSLGLIPTTRSEGHLARCPAECLGNSDTRPFLNSRHEQSYLLEIGDYSTRAYDRGDRRGGEIECGLRKG